MNYSRKEEIIWSLLRLAMGWIFLWAFLDKTFGLGFATKLENAWIYGGSPTHGYLTFATKGPLADLYQAMASSGFVEWLFMLGILFVGIALMSGIMVRLGAIAGAVMMFLFYTSGFIPPEHNPFLDEHMVNFVIMIGLVVVVPSRMFGLGAWWREIPLVKKYPVLQ